MFKSVFLCLALSSYWSQGLNVVTVLGQGASVTTQGQLMPFLLIPMYLGLGHRVDCFFIGLTWGEPEGSQTMKVQTWLSVRAHVRASQCSWMKMNLNVSQENTQELDGRQ